MTLEYRPGGPTLAEQFWARIPDLSGRNTMMHTPGPWRANGVQIDGPDGMLAEVGFGMRKDEETLANARLIAAAPDLLTAAEWVERYASDMMRRGLAEIPDPAVRALVAAIAAARGSEVPA